MSANLDNGENFLAAHSHHEQAASFNREASRHFEAGKDYAHASHQAWTAHGHALQARDLAAKLSCTMANTSFQARRQIHRCRQSSRLHRAASVETAPAY